MWFSNLFRSRGRYHKVDPTAKIGNSTINLSPKRAKTLCVLAILFISTVILSKYSGDDFVHRLSALDTLSTKSGHTKEEWITATVHGHVDGTVDMRALTSKCDAADWLEGLTLTCTEVIGGVGNVRNKMLNCIRFAIEAGAGLVLPYITVRSTDNLAMLLSDDHREYDYMFNSSETMALLSTYCPQLTVYHDLEVYKRQTAKPYTDLFLPYFDYGNDFFQWNWRQLFRLEAWATEFLADVRNKSGWFSKEKPVLVDIKGPIYSWGMDKEPRAFQFAMGRLVAFNDRINEIAGAILYNIAQKLQDLALDFAGEEDLGDIHPRGFFGAHLRTASDAIGAGWAGYEQQAPRYISEASKRDLKLIYVASGAPDDLARFKEDAAVKGLTVVSKNDLMSSDEFTAMQDLTWDQLGLVDYAVMLRSAFFMGIDNSSFADGIALTRRGNPMSGVVNVEVGQGVLSTREGYTIADDLNAIIGGPGNLIWTVNGMWP